MCKKRESLLKELTSFLLVILIITIFGTFTYYMWRIEGRTSDDISFFIKEEKQKKADIARTVLPLLEELEKMRRKIARSGSMIERAAASRSATAIANAIAVLMPELAISKDHEGNAVLMPTESARNRIETVLKEAENTS